MESGLTRTQGDYTLAFKLSVVDLVEKGGLTYKEAQARNAIRGRSSVLVWLRKHGWQRWSVVGSLLQRPADLAQAKRVVDRSVAIYKLERPQCLLQLKTPDEVHRASLADIHQPKRPATTGVNP